MDLLDVLFAAKRDDIDSVPFEHEDYWTDRVGEVAEHLSVSGRVS